MRRALTEEQAAAKLKKQMDWFASAAGVAFKKRQAERAKKFENAAAREKATNERKKAKRRVDLKENLRSKMRNCKQRAKKEGLAFDLDIDYLMSIYQPSCPYLGVPLVLEARSGNNYNTVSIDKIDPLLGYTKGNVQIISFKANVMKQDVDLLTLQKFAESVIRLHGRQNG